MRLHGVQQGRTAPLRLATRRGEKPRSGGHAPSWREPQRRSQSKARRTASRPSRPVHTELEIHSTHGAPGGTRKVTPGPRHRPARASEAWPQGRRGNTSLAGLPLRGGNHRGGPRPSRHEPPHRSRGLYKLSKGSSLDTHARPGSSSRLKLSSPIKTVFKMIVDDQNCVQNDRRRSRRFENNSSPRRNFIKN